MDNAEYGGRTPTGARGRWSFLAITFGITWTVAAVGVLVGLTIEDRIGYMVLAAVCMLCPALAAIIQQRWIEKGPWSGLGLQFAGTRWTWVVITALIGLSIVPLMLIVTSVSGALFGLDSFGAVEVSQGRLVQRIQEMTAEAGMSGIGAMGSLSAMRIPGVLLLAIIQLAALISACTINLPMMLGEELGWRGYLFKSMQQGSSIRRVLFTGVVWGLWHAPLIAMGHNYPEYPILGIPLMMLFCVLLAVPFDHARWRSGSIWAPCILHGIINGSAGGFGLFAWGGHPLVGSPVGLAGFITLALLTIGILVFDGGYRATFTGIPPAAPRAGGAITN